MMTTMNVKSNSYTQHHTKAVQLAESGLELLRRVDYNNELPDYDGVSAWPTATSARSPITRNFAARSG